MLWLTWRQHRARALLTALLIAGLAQLLVLVAAALAGVAARQVVSHFR